jgi:oleandomycin transport system ATP-binding protein
MSYAIRAEGLVKRYGDMVALDGVDLEVPAGKVIGVLGPNGAGKTTTVRILSTLMRPDAGRATVGGFDVVKDPVRVRGLIGLTGQYASVDEGLSGVENLVLLGRLLGLSRRDARTRAAELLEQFELTEAATRPISTFSGSMRRRSGAWCGGSSRTAPPCCSPRSTWRRPINSPTASPCSTTAASSPRAGRTS